MKKVLVVIVGLCLICLCACKKEITSNSSLVNSGNNVNLVESNTSAEIIENTDDISIQEIIEDSVEVDFETGDVIEKGDSEESSQQTPDITFDKTDVNSSKTSSGNQTSNDDKQNEDNVIDENRETMNGFEPWE